MDLTTFVNGIRFNFISPLDIPGDDGWFSIQRSNGSVARILPIAEFPLDISNTCLPDGENFLKPLLNDLVHIPRMSAFAMAAIIQRVTSCLSTEAAFVNVGLWQGFTFLSGVSGNPDIRCIGIDNFSQYGGPREAFAERFQQLSGPAHSYHDMDYRKYFEEVHSEPIGFYIYDGEHSYANQLLGLQIAEPYFTEDCIILVDDTNWSEPRRAIRDFLAQSANHYRVLFDQPTYPYSGSFTFWNGCTILQRVSAREVMDYPEQPRRIPWGEVESRAEHPPTPSDPKVTIIAIQNGDASDVALRSEKELTGSNGAELIQVQLTGGTEALRSAIDQSSGDYIAVSYGRVPRNGSFVAASIESRGKFAQWVARELNVARVIAKYVPRGAKIILADGQQLNRQVADCRECLPFTERAGRYWGNPLTNRHAMEELGRLRSAGAEYFVLGWPVFWWRQHYGLFYEHMMTRNSLLYSDEDAVIFKLT